MTSVQVQRAGSTTAARAIWTRYKKLKRVEGAPRQKEQRGKQQGVEDHHGGDHPRGDRGGGLHRRLHRPERCRDVGDDPERDEREERRQGESDAHQLVHHSDGDQLPGHGSPPQLDQP